MKSLTQTSVILLITLALLMTVTAVSARGPMSFNSFDQDGSGSISQQEFETARAERMAKRAQQGYPMRNAGNAPSFATIDSNGDGQVDANEFSAHQAMRRQQRQQFPH